MHSDQSRYTLSKSQVTAIQLFYFFSQFFSIGSSFSGSMLGAYDYSHKNGREHIAGTNLLWIVGLGLIAGSIGSFTAHKFQGQKIGLHEEEHHEKPRLPSYLIEKNTKSERFQTLYILFALVLSATENYLMISSLNAFIQNSDEPILPPGLFSFGTFLFLAKTFFLDMPFDGSNSLYEACDEINESITGNKGSVVLDPILRFFTKNKFRLNGFFFWINTAGVFSHTTTDIIAFNLSITSLLSIIPGFITIDTLSDLVNTPLLMYPLLFISILLLIPNTIQTRNFEAEETKQNMLNLFYNQRLKQRSSLLPQKKSQSLMHSLLSYSPKLKKVLRSSFISQAPLHGFGDTMPVAILFRDIFKRYNMHNDLLPATITWGLSLIVFFGSSAGTLFSEVTTALENFDEKFETQNENSSYFGAS